LGNVFANPSGMPTIHFELHLKGGEVLQGGLPFKWDEEGKRWVGWEGLDWHVHSNAWVDWWNKTNGRTQK
jgi:hypothetical protein